MLHILFLQCVKWTWCKCSFPDLHKSCSVMRGPSPLFSSSPLCLSIPPPLASPQPCFQVEILLPWWFQSLLLLHHDEGDQQKGDALYLHSRTFTGAVSANINRPDTTATPPSANPLYTNQMWDALAEFMLKFLMQFILWYCLHILLILFILLYAKKVYWLHWPFNGLWWHMQGVSTLCPVHSEKDISLLLWAWFKQREPLTKLTITSDVWGKTPHTAYQLPEWSMILLLLNMNEDGSKTFVAIWDILWFSYGCCMKTHYKLEWAC